MMSKFFTIINNGGYQKVMRNISQICSRIKNLTEAEDKIVISFKPSILDQLNSYSVAGWNKTCTRLYASLATCCDVSIHLLQSQQGSKVIDLNELDQGTSNEDIPENSEKFYDHVCLGGTFDRLHTGHKILLSTGMIYCKESLTVGVAGPELLKKKTLKELIEPVEVRIKGVEQFLSEVNSNIELKVCEIKDPYGPAASDPLLQCIVASSETEQGCLAINRVRNEKGLTALDIKIIPLIDNPDRRGSHEEEKISSSTKRCRLLGERLRPSKKKWAVNSGPYIIGLTGGSASGKSSIARRLERRGAGLVDCDKLGHAAYSPGSKTLEKIVQEFGNEVLLDDGTINRSILGAKVFSDKKLLQKLNEIVWPEILQMAKERSLQLYSEGHSVVILDAAVLLEAGWDQDCHEIWVCTVPREEAVSRIVHRDAKSKEQAENRIDSQMSNEGRCQVATTVFCTLWDPEVTEQQVDCAWKRLEKELNY